MKDLLGIFKDGYDRFFHSGEMPSWQLIAVYCLFFFAILNGYESVTLWMVMFLFLHSTAGVPKGIQIFLDLLYSLLFSLFIMLIVLSVLKLVGFLFR